MRKQTLSKRQEIFCEKYLETGNASRAAAIAGYGKTTAFQILKSPLVQARLDELKRMVQAVQDQAGVQSIMSVLERKERLSVIGRATLPEFINAEGEIQLEGENRGALAELVVEDWRGVGREGEESSISRTKKVKLHNPITAIQELNKMDAVYPTEPASPVQVNLVWVIGKGYQNADADNKHYLPANQQDPK